ncbi:D-alanyl-D-alanine carboxypeptidase family protein [Aquibacillus salsiterrae]|uniref:D-alanyl-D-alanine carboxypeptidase family protein n=1 Tax=Aquibacillus salsiterrae TaxID=2950439 RepID=UPI002FEE55CA
MKRLLIVLVCTSLLATMIPTQVMAKPQVSARNAILIEQSTGRVLYEKAANDKHLIASITKIMTAILAVESGKLDDTVTVSRNAAYTEGSSIYLKEGDKMKLRDLVYGLMLRSGNDAAVAIAEYVGGSVGGFTYLMNDKAAWLGMNNSQFDNPHGLDSKTHYSTAYDMALLMRYAMKNDIFKEITGSTSYKAENRKYAWGNKNKLLTRYYDYSTGGKTGYTRAAGRTLVSTAEKDGMELIVVTLDAPDDWKDHMRLFEWGFDNYEMTKVQNKGMETFKIKGTDETESGFFNKDIVVPLTKDERDQLQIQTYFKKEQNNQTVNDVIGKKVFKLDNELVAEASIYRESEQENEEKNQTFVSDMLQIFQQLVGVGNPNG